MGVYSICRCDGERCHTLPWHARVAAFASTASRGQSCLEAGKLRRSLVRRRRVNTDYQDVRKDLAIAAAPIVLLTSVMAATVYGIIYLFSESLEIVYFESFGLVARQISLVTLSIAVGVAFTFLPRLYDIRVAMRREKKNRVLEPEDKLFGFILAAPVLACGL